MATAGGSRGAAALRSLSQCGATARLGHAVWLWQPWRQDPDELRRRLRPTLDRAFARWCFTVERQAEAVGGGLLRPGREDGRDHASCRL